MTLTRADKAFCRKWTKAFRKGQQTREITLAWLQNKARPKTQPKTLMKLRGDMSGMAVTVDFYSATSSELDRAYEGLDYPLWVKA